MGLILNMDTATENASVALCKNGGLLLMRENNRQKEHASFLHVAVQELMAEAGFKINDLDAIAITSGPGSYTGLRVSMAAAKGFCYALNKPLIAVNTLYMMAFAARQHIAACNLPVAQQQLIVPMIDARRMEVFMALYDLELNVREEPAPVILTAEIIEKLKQLPAFYLGNGCQKFLHTDSDYFLSINVNSKHLGEISYLFYQQKKYSDIISIEPEYFKGFYSNVKVRGNQ